MDTTKYFHNDEEAIKRIKIIPFDNQIKIPINNSRSDLEKEITDIAIKRRWLGLDNQASCEIESSEIY